MSQSKMPSPNLHPAMSTSPQFQETTKVLEAFSEALRFWNASLLAKDETLQKSVPPANIAQPLVELEKTVKLIKAHTTKVGIIFQPAQICSSGNATFSTISELSKSFILFISALSSVSPKEESSLFYDEIRSICTSLVNSALQFTHELTDILGATNSKDEEGKGSKESGMETQDTKSRILETTDKSQSKNPDTQSKNPDTKSKNQDKNQDTIENQETSQPLESDPRLVSVGKIWNTCDDLVKLLGEGKLKFLEKKSKMHLSLIEDGLDEFAEWTEDPNNFDDEDPFGLDEFSDDEVEVPGGPAHSDNTLSDNNDDDDDSNVQESVISFSKIWLQKFKLVKLLFLSINKSLSSLVSGEKIDGIFAMEGAICRHIDSLIVELMVNKVLDDEVTEISKSIDKSCFGIIRLLRDANRTSENKVKWCASWEAKYSDLSQEMYSS